MNIQKQFIKYVSQNICGMLGISCYIIVDTFFISQAAGTDGITVLNLVLPVYNLIFAIGSMIGVGSATRYTILKAQEDDSAKKYFANAILCILMISIPFVLSGIFSPDTGSIDLKNHSVSLRFENHIFYSTVTADVDFQVKFPIRFFGSDQPVALKMHSRSVAPVTDTPEFIQNVDMAIDYADSTGLSEKLNQLTGKVREFFGR